MADHSRTQQLGFAIQIELREARGEGLCSLLNTIMRREANFGVGTDLIEFLIALDLLRRRKIVQVCEYGSEGGRRVLLRVVYGSVAWLESAFSFDSERTLWQSRFATDLEVELCDDHDQSS